MPVERDEVDLRGIDDVEPEVDCRCIVVVAWLVEVDDCRECVTGEVYI